MNVIVARVGYRTQLDAHNRSSVLRVYLDPKNARSWGEGNCRTYAETFPGHEEVIYVGYEAKLAGVDCYAMWLASRVASSMCVYVLLKKEDLGDRWFPPVYFRPEDAADHALRRGDGFGAFARQVVDFDLFTAWKALRAAEKQADTLERA
jgi:hypothetical protein